MFAIGISLSKYAEIAVAPGPEGLCTALLCAFSLAQIGLALLASALRESVAVEPQPATAMAAAADTHSAGWLMLRGNCAVQARRCGARRPKLIRSLQDR